MKPIIDNELSDIEKTQGVTVLYAAEAGSRAWGFESPDSDWDVRFIYARPARDYLVIDKPADTIQRMNPTYDIDLSGWDIFKAAHLLRKSNPALFEWLRSPSVYTSQLKATEAFRRMMRDHGSLRASGYHYISMAKTNYLSYIANRETVRLKKYLYCVRPLLCAKWVMEKRTFPPVDFGELRAGLSLRPEVNKCIDALVEQKVRVDEAMEGSHMPALDAFLGAAISIWRAAVERELPETEFPVEPVNHLVQDIVLSL